MDTALENGDFLLDSRNLPIQISGTQEVLQRALIRLTIKKGSFIYNKELGSKLYTLSAFDPNVKTQALNLVKEALSDMLELTVKDIDLEFSNQGQNMQIKVFLLFNQETQELVVNV